MKTLAQVINKAFGPEAEVINGLLFIWGLCFAAMVLLTFLLVVLKETDVIH